MGNKVELQIPFFTEYTNIMDKSFKLTTTTIMGAMANGRIGLCSDGAKNKGQVNAIDQYTL
jgi:hypothetical protein